MFNRKISVVLCLAMLLTVLAGCTPKKEDTWDSVAKNGDGKYEESTTFSEEFSSEPSTTEAVWSPFA